MAIIRRGQQLRLFQIRPAVAVHGMVIGLRINVAAGITGTWSLWMMTPGPDRSVPDVPDHWLIAGQARPVGSSQTTKARRHDEGHHPDRIRGPEQGPEDR